MIEELIGLRLSELYFHFWLHNLPHLRRNRMIVTWLGGLALTTVGLARLAGRMIDQKGLRRVE